MIEMVLGIIISNNPPKWQLSCEQTVETIQTVMMDPWFAKPENRHHRLNLIQKIKRHGPANCIPV